MKELYLYRPESWDNDDPNGILLTPCPPDEWRDRCNEYWGIVFEIFIDRQKTRLIWRKAMGSWNYGNVLDKEVALLDLDRILEELL